MSRHVLSAPVGEVLFGWDPPIEGFFLQYFESSAASDDPPTMWLPRLDLDELERQLLTLGIAMPALLRRALLAEMHDHPLCLEAGDPVLWRGSPASSPKPCTLLQPMATFALVRWPDGNEHYCLLDELELDLERFDDAG